MLYFVTGLVVGAGVIVAVYRFHVIPKWEAAVAAAKRDYAALWARAQKLGL